MLVWHLGNKTIDNFFAGMADWLLKGIAKNGRPLSRVLGRAIRGYVLSLVVPTSY